MGNAGNILFSELTNKMLMFDAGKGCVKESTKELYKNLFRKLEILEIKSGVYYRARKIDQQKDVIEKKSIIMDNSGKVYGFDENNSGVPPKSECKAGRLNKVGEQVLYMTDDTITCLYEIKPKLKEYISVAKFEVVNPIKILDFTPFCKTDYINFFNSDAESLFEQKGYSFQELFVGIQRILMLPVFQENDYKVSNEIADMIKEVSKEKGVDGINYKSFFTKGNNIALWNYDNLKFIEGSSEVYNYNKQDSYEYFLALNSDKVICKEDFPNNIRMDIVTCENRKSLINNLFCN